MPVHTPVKSSAAFVSVPPTCPWRRRAHGRPAPVRRRVLERHRGTFPRRTYSASRAPLDEDVAVRHLRVKAAEPVGRYSVRLELTDGRVVERDLERLLTGPVFDPLRASEECFRALRAEGGTLVLHGEVDLDPDVLIWGGPEPGRSGRSASVAASASSCLTQLRQWMATSRGSVRSVLLVRGSLEGCDEERITAALLLDTPLGMLQRSPGTASQASALTSWS
jgi:hypothetical protein